MRHRRPPKSTGSETTSIALGACAHLLLVIADRHRSLFPFAVVKNTRQRTVYGPIEATAGSTRVALHCRASPAPTTTAHSDTLPRSSASDTVGSENRRLMACERADRHRSHGTNLKPPPASGTTGSASTAHSHTVNTDRAASTRSANRRSQPLRLPGEPSVAIRRNPARLVAFAAAPRPRYRRRVGCWRSCAPATTHHLPPRCTATDAGTAAASRAA